jgi:AraC-like DNA-binding protein
MQTNNIENKTIFHIDDPVLEITQAPRPIIALARDYADGHTGSFHRHSCSQLVFASSGVMTVTTETGMWVVPPFRAVWVPAYTEHRVAAAGRLSIRTLFIKPDVATSLPASCCVVSVPPLLRELILHAMKLPRLYEPGSADERIMNVILDFIETLEVTPLDLPIPSDARLQKIHRALAHNPSDNRTLDEWGVLVGATARTLARLFRAETGMSFRQWRQQVRILEGLRRLGRNESVTSVALDLGYDSPSAFIAMFRKALGTTPGRYFSM